MRRIDYFIVPFIMDFAISGSGLIANLMAQDLGAHTKELGLLGVAWGLPYAVLCMTAGKAVSRYDRRRILVASTLLFAVYAAICAFAKSPLHLILAGPIGGIASALFWPSYETLLHDDDPAETNKRLTVFNTGWTLGIMSGAAIGGYAYPRIGGHIVFMVLALTVFLDALYIAQSTRHGITPYKPSHEEGSSTEGAKLPYARRVGYMRMAWLANFCMWFGGATASTIFPKLARTLSISDQDIGAITATVWIGQLVVFYLLNRSRAWHYRIKPMLALQLVGMLGMVLMAHGYDITAFVVAYLLLGAGRGLAYTASLFYGLDTNGPGAANTGLHEAIVGAAFVLAPLVSGYTAEISLRLPFTIAAWALGSAFILQAIMWRMLPTHNAT